MMREKLDKRESGREFKKGSQTKPINNRPPPMRGGYRL